MLELLLMLVSSFSAQSVETKQAVRSSANGEFIASHYPPEALKRGEEGKVGFRLVIEPDGSLGTCEVTQSSGFKSLDNETCELILRYARLKAVRNSEGRAVRAVQNGHINWKLPAGAVKMASATPTKSHDPDKIICRRSATTGSLIKKTKQCMTARHWAEAQRIARDTAERIIGVGNAEDEFGAAVCPSGLPDC